MPFAVWCSSCPKPTVIGQGVRFNAEKKKGSGGEEGMEILTTEERERRRQDAFTVLEGKKEEKVQEKEHRFRIEELRAARDRDWDDPYEASRRLRKEFRVERKDRENKAKATEELRDRMGLDIELLAESDGDAERAGFVEFGTLGEVNVASKPLFEIEDVAASGKAGKTKDGTKTKAQVELERRRQALQHEIRSNTRAARDPFLSNLKSKQVGQRTAHAMSGIKRKRPMEASESARTKTTKAGIAAETPSSPLLPQPISLVAYDSD
ncbi:Protein saf4 [Taxawa tesnikishii (nom. ined.)]|nr:Protein saf4 [Dothideales sp. JES 119]